MTELFWKATPGDKLQRRGVITLVTAPGDNEVTVVPDETLGEQDPLLAKLLAAATASVTDLRGSGAWERGRLEPRRRANRDGKATREDEPATLDL